MLNCLEPSWISEGDDDAEALTIEIWIEGFPIRLVCGYGPQEGDRKERKNKFWEYINNETQNAKKEGAGFILQMDGNLWAGKGIIKDDPNTQNQNGKLFQNYLCSNPNLSVVNALPVCEGMITRKRHTTKGTEVGVLDFFVVCEKILPLVTKMVIDEAGESALTRYRGGKVVKADHNMLKMEVNLTFHMDNRHERRELFNLRNKLCQKQFQEFTTNTDRFTKCFTTDEPFEVQFSRWKRQFQKALHANFRKVRVKEDKDKKLSDLDIMLNKKKTILKKKNIKAP